MNGFTLNCRSKRRHFDASPLAFAPAIALLYMSCRDSNSETTFPAD